jgi:hypothetical protein
LEERKAGSNDGVDCVDCVDCVSRASDKTLEVK